MLYLICAVLGQMHVELMSDMTEGLSSFLCQSLQPDIIVFSNALLSGVLSELRPRFAGRILCLLQGRSRCFKIFIAKLVSRQGNNSFVFGSISVR